MTTLYMPVARLGGDLDYFAVADDGNELQFFSRKPDAEKSAKAHIKNYDGDYYVLEFKAYKTKSAIAQPRKSAINFEWQRYTNATRPPNGKKVHIKGINTSNDSKITEVAWRIDRKRWNWNLIGKITPVPDNIQITHWRLMRRSE